MKKLMNEYLIFLLEALVLLGTLMSVVVALFLTLLPSALCVYYHTIWPVFLYLPFSFPLFLIYKFCKETFG